MERLPAIFVLRVGTSTGPSTNDEHGTGHGTACVPSPAVTHLTGVKTCPSGNFGTYLPAPGSTGTKLRRDIMRLIPAERMNAMFVHQYAPACQASIFLS
ncbi:hypothetical protein JAAARDRAFT_57220 [Jaapia argillacea MUCL 33604]|uniref:Uncharacterized protein n=1 Tax=Jaapia argillacea MUCL 33604 TaxID=933084 RepID=A0A067PZJ1_9AGAM|nr:hypothetical protein JAAARDRAFT_57220 [Jaapia argillacea MUCL 33604]